MNSNGMYHRDERTCCGVEKSEFKRSIGWIGEILQRMSVCLCVHACACVCEKEIVSRGFSGEGVYA